MGSFIKNTMSSVLGTIIGFFLFFLLFLLIASAIGSGGDKKVTIEENSALMFTLNKPIVERTNDKDQQGIDMDLGPFSANVPIGLKQILSSIDQAKNDERIKGIFLNVSGISASSSSAFDVRNALENFKESGKWIVAYAEGFTQGGYYIASVADELYLYPEGSLSWQGIGGKSMYLKNMLDNLDIEMQIIRGPNNKYKSAVEPLMYDHMSEPSHEQMEELIGDIWTTMLKGIAENRNISVEQLNQYANNISVSTAMDAKSLGFVDDLKYQDEVMTILQEKLGVDEVVMDGKKKHLVSFSKYYKPKKSGSYDSKRIAVVYATGGIESGKGDDETIGSITIAKALRNARLDEKVEAVVLRVNSPGGSALASDVIWRETQLIKEAGKPFVVSMGGVAASGGYYIAAGADKIFANNNTITGSIGVFGILPNLKNFYENKIGITLDGVSSNGHNSWSINYPLDSVQRKAVEISVTDIYNGFLSKVAEGRNMTTDQVDAIAQGRVWSGEDAKEVGLVDEIGDLQAAIDEASRMAGLEEYRIKELPKMEDPLEKLLKQMIGEASLEMYLGSEAEKIREIEKLLTMKGVQARIFFDVELN